MATVHERILGEVRRATTELATGMERNLEELRHHVRLATAVLAGVLAALGLISQARWAVAPYAAGLVGIAMLVALGAAMVAVQAAAGRRSLEAATGADAEAIVAGLDLWTEKELVASLAETELRHAQAMRMGAQRLALAVSTTARLLMATTATVAIAMALIVRKAI